MLAHQWRASPAAPSFAHHQWRASPAPHGSTWTGVHHGLRTLKALAIMIAGFAASHTICDRHNRPPAILVPIGVKITPLQCQRGPTNIARAEQLLILCFESEFHSGSRLLGYSWSCPSPWAHALRARRVHGRKHGCSNTQTRTSRRTHATSSRRAIKEFVP